MVDNIIRAGEHASMLTRQLLAFTRRRPETIGIHDLRDVVNDLSKLLDRLTGERVELTVDVCGAPVWVEADRGNIEQVIFNLVANAKDAITGNGSVRIALTTERAATAVLCVSDTGRGMSQDIVDKIFEPFFTTKAEGRGTGLGLATVRRILNDTGGTVEVDTSPGQGTSFTIRLPLTSASTVESDFDGFSFPAPPFLADIVLLDDNAMVRKTTRAMLENAGHRVREGASGEEGIALITHDGPVDLVLTDVIMPGISGMALIDEVRARGLDIPFIFMTGYADPDIDIDTMAETSDMIYKPVRQGVLLRKVAEVLDRSQRTEA